MNRRLVGYTLLSLLSLDALAQKEIDRKNIEKFCGCFDVEFKYAETFSPNENYTFREREEMFGQEAGIVIERSDKKISIQHVLVMGDSFFIKHWREDWVYEQPYLWQYTGGRKWVKVSLKPEEYKNKWMQTIWEVDDAPRYQGISNWVNTDGKTFWQNTANAPLPRREYKTRSDYNILKRTNRLIVSDNGWTHEQDNEKIVASASGNKLIAQEKGYNIYTKIDDKECANALTWWKSQEAFWSKVRAEWNSYMSNTSRFQLQKTIDNKTILQHFDELTGRFQRKELALENVTRETKIILDKFVVKSDMAVK
jgi:hypothetical protein